MTEPFGVPFSKLYLEDFSWLTVTWIFLSIRKAPMYFRILPVIPQFFILYIRPSCQTRSNAFDISKNTAPVICPESSAHLTSVSDPLAHKQGYIYYLQPSSDWLNPCYLIGQKSSHFIGWSKTSFQCHTDFIYLARITSVYHRYIEHKWKIVTYICVI